MRQGVMRQEQKAHCRISDPILDKRICAGYAPGIKIWLDEPDELARYSFQKKARQAAMTFHKRAKANIECKMTATSFITSILVMRQPMRRIYIYIYIYEKIKYFFGYAPTYAPARKPYF